ncbi:thiamine biosynthesis lipoprotein [Arthrobacter silviterrae]|uniref:FAD:protein FMN transferase n=1 Tax=Arthrobacter silviterrae TaxID=2026658 RepID=A0ABX0DJ08_9MICC|nr:FAD:protein FMN transferase [Arthrobacter silviterrae]MDQ0275962.1 thiamine biosynthesis lipoprotein [Arthrobacter silviterrae]NGN84212.1 FAD:protein FMN transferase [Arthrobacter silviterrae]
MGTVFSFDISAPGVSAHALQGVVDWLHRMDAMFSTYRPDSEISRLDRGSLQLGECSPEVHEVLELCEQASRDSGGYFTARLPGGLDPSGMVKGWAVERASTMLQAAGSTAHAVNGGGDIQLLGKPQDGRPWTIGIADPFRRTALATTVAGTDMAVATSSTAERGQHIIDPTSGLPATALASITVTGRNLTTVDAYATAALAMGDKAKSWISGLSGVEAFAITATGERWQTPNFPTAGNPGN